MVKSTVTTIVPPTHAEKHCVGGDDPLILPLVHHASTHEEGGVDEITGFAHVGFPNATVRNGPSPTSWSDLNLSSYVGSNKALVLLAIATNSNYGYGYMVMQKSGDETLVNSSYWGNACGGFTAAAGKYIYVVGVTNDNGVISWKSTNNANSTIKLLAYVKG